jgi:hypothetical protein
VVTVAQLQLLAVIIMLFPILYFGIASLTFFFAKLHDPVVTRVLRGLFNTYFIGLVMGSVVGVVAFAITGRSWTATTIGLVGTCAALARRWFLHRLDIQVAARDCGDAAAIRHLRQLHMSGIAYNAVHLIALVASIPFTVPIP